jgi:signal transduction histidine kinase/CheY-like chemotaxis protein
MKLELNFRVRLMLAMMLLIVVVTGATVYIAGNNLRANQDRTLEQQFHTQVRSFIALQEARSNAIAEKCRALSHSVRLRAALEEHDVEDLYRNALSELLSVLEAPAEPGDETNPTLASFFRFFDAKGELLTTREPAAGGVGDSFLENALVETGRALTGVNDQSIGFIAVGTGDRPQSLRAIVATKIRDWNGRSLGTLVLGFSPSEMRLSNGSAGSEIKNGIWLGDRFYIEGLSASDRHVVAHHLSFDGKQRVADNVAVDLQSGPHLLFHKPLNPESELTPAYDVCLYPLAPFLHEARVFRWKIIGLGLGVLGGGLVTSLFVARNLSKPVDQLVATSAENFSRRKKAEEDLHETNRELEKALRELKATQKQVIQQERLSALGQMAAGVAHDFNNALMPILGFADVLLRNDALLSDKAEARRCLEMLRTSAKDAASVVSRLREFYRPAEADEEFPIVDLSRIIEQSVALTEPKWRGLTQARGITVSVETQFDARPIVAGDESALREVLTNLLFNAVDAMPDGGQISLQTAIADNHAVLSVRDTGTGMTETVRQRCLEPFFSTKGDRGTGLGLSMVYGIIERHHGHLDIESAVGKGTTFIIRLPLAEEAPVAVAVTDAPKADSSLNVLVVDDELRSREVLTAYLRTDNHAVATASSGREALEKFKRGRFDLVVMDRAMPEMNGEQTAQFIKKVNGDVPIILLTGFSGGVEAKGTDAIDVVLHKPITLETLRHTISDIVYAR